MFTFNYKITVMDISKFSYPPEKQPSYEWPQVFARSSKAGLYVSQVCPTIAFILPYCSHLIVQCHTLYTTIGESPFLPFHYCILNV